ncbi:MAG: hypothetical protein IPJ09_00030 [Saprospiraceae bacterium]|nr:hypothetical protein [Saprospiraceae bacterium]
MMTNASDPVWNHINLNELRHIMDPTADQAIEEVYRSKSFDQLRTQLQNMAENDDHAKADMPPALHSFLQK